MKNSIYQPKRSKGPNPFVWIILFCTSAILLSGKSNAQSHCDREKIFVAGFNIEVPTNLKLNYPPVPSIYCGISGIYGKGTLVDNFCATVGTRFMMTELSDKSASDVLQAVPVASIMYRIRLNGAESKVIHAFSFTTSLDHTGFNQYDYRIYGAPNGKSFATIGGIAGWNNLTGITIGFTAIGFF